MQVKTTEQNRLKNYYYSIVESINNNLYFNSKHFFIVKLHHYYNYCYDYSVRRDNIFIIQNALYETKNIINLDVWICHYQESEKNKNCEFRHQKYKCIIIVFLALPKTELCVAKFAFYILSGLNIFSRYILQKSGTQKNYIR